MYKIKDRINKALLSLASLIDPASVGNPYVKAQYEKRDNFSYRTYLNGTVRTVKHSSI